MASDRVYISLFQMGPLHLIQLYHEGHVGLWCNMEPYRLYLIIHIHRICIIESTWFLNHIWEDPSDILCDVCIYFPTDMFSMNSEFAVNQQYIIAHLLYDERVLIVGRMLWDTDILLHYRWIVITPQKIYSQCCTIRRRSCEYTDCRSSGDISHYWWTV